MAKKILDTKKSSYEEWVDLRRNSIGGSEASIVMGCNTWASPLSLYANKKGLTRDKETSVAMQVGTWCEELVAKMFEEESGLKVRNDFFMYQHEELPFITANIDRRIVGENAGLECKTTQAYTLKDFEGGNVPATYYWQCVQYMGVLGFDRMYLAAILSNRHFVWRIIERNEEDIKRLFEAEAEFWREHIEKNVAPNADGSEASAEALKEIYPEAEEELTIYDDEIDYFADVYVDASAQEKKWKKVKETAQQNIEQALGKAEKGHGERFVATWKNTARTSLDAKRLKDELPEVYAKYCNTTTSRRFSCKEVKND